MPPITKKPCINSSEWTYTGKEVSPTGLGYAPDGETEGTKMKGRDDTMWIVGRKNGVKVWNRVPTVLVKEEPVLSHDEDEEANSDDEEDEDQDHEDKEEPATPPKPEPKVVVKAPAAPKKVKKDVVPKIDTKDVTIKKNLIDRLNEVAEPEPEPEPVPAKETEPEPPAAVPEKKKRAPAKKKEKEAIKEPEPPAALPEPSKEEAKPAPEPEKKKRAPAKKKEGAEGDAAPAKKTDYQLFLTERLKTIEGVTHKERFGAAAKEWGAMTVEQKAAAVEKLK